MAAMLCCGLSTAVFAAKVLIIRSSGPTKALYPDGMMLDESASLILKAGSQVTIISGSGTRTLRGPGNFRLAVIDQTIATPSRGSTLSALISQGGERRARIGAIRSMGGSICAHSGPSIIARHVIA